jgi:hypothetical protein
MVPVSVWTTPVAVGTSTSVSVVSIVAPLR